MQFPIKIFVGGLTVPIHFVCETLAYFIGYRYYSYLRKHTADKISDSNRLIIFIGAAAGAFIGSHLLGILENPDRLSQLDLLYFLGNKTIVGGMLGGLIGVELIKKQINVNVSSGDLMVYPLILAMIIGRVGCFFAGLEDGTYGIPSSLPWAMDLGDGITRHPTNLYEIIFWLLLAGFIYALERKHPLSDGSRFKIFLSSYLVFRLLIEFIKPDHFFSIGLSVIQLACIGGILYYYKVFLFPKHLLKPNQYA